MARICPGCGHVHPEGAVTCERAREMIDQFSRELEHDIRHHQETCPGCPDPRRHVLNLRRLREKREGNDIVFRAAV